MMAVSLMACSSDEKAASAPVAKMHPVTLELHGDTRVDNYYWLRERENPEVISYLEAENAHTEKSLEPFREHPENRGGRTVGRDAAGDRQGRGGP